jgi:superfamily II DNA or RNA helicase
MSDTNLPILNFSSKGISICKHSISLDEQYKIKNDLTVKPFVPPNSLQTRNSFSIYRESNKKIYVPRFYAIKKFNYTTPPNAYCKHNNIQKYTDNSFQFNGDLRDYQKSIINTYISESKKNGCGLLEIPCGRGKTVMALNIISILKVKTLVIVHKEFLLNQWIERIQQFLPNVSVGKIQGKIIQTENYDIVIGMLQSLSMKEYNSQLFQQFGLTIVDECHHIGAEVFSRSLFKIVTPYMLGLSATMERKDKTSNVFRMFLGDVVYSEKPKTDQEVLIRCVFYEDENEEYANTEYNFRGQVHYSRMIKKICEYEYRTILILRILEDIQNEVENRQIMILAHNKSILNILFQEINRQNIGSVGYYVGGMKESQLKESESKSIILATYAMAEEALDIKTLSALILATPKTDVTQAVGRILRVKHAHPLVVDIVDQHDIFQRQWLKRKSYYKKCNYTIKQIHSNNYNNKFDSWNACVKKSKPVQNVNNGKCLINI